VYIYTIELHSSPAPAKMSSELLINVTPTETRIALIENGVLQEVFIERANRRGLVGNIYKGRVTRVLPGMQAAFVDVGLDRAAFLHASDVIPASQADAAGRPAAGPGPAGSDPRAGGSIGELLREGEAVLVQVIKEPIGSKGARLTTQISIPSCYLVYLPYGGSVGVSQRIEDEPERQRLRELASRCSERSAGLDLRAAGGTGGTVTVLRPNGGYIVRTAAELVPDELIEADMQFLEKLWASIEAESRTCRAPQVIHEDLPLHIRTLRELSGSDIEKVRIDSRETYRKVVEFAETFIPELAARVEHYPGERPIFDLYGVEDEIQKALERKVQLKSGGHLVIDQTEAMTTIDVNTGAFVGHRNQEETIFKTNLEAAQAIARQLRLRNLGGIIIIDFIDMLSDEHKRQVLRALDKALERDHTKSQISEVSALGLVQMTRKRTRESLEHVLCDACPTCNGRGTIKTPETVCYEIFREIIREARQFDDVERLLVLAAQEVVDRLLDEESANLAELEAFTGKPITLQVETLYSQEQYDIVLM